MKSVICFDVFSDIPMNFIFTYPSGGAYDLF